MSLRINVYGNVCNNAYSTAKFLRRAGIDAHLYLERNFPFRPEHDDPELAGRYPDWIHSMGDVRWLRYGLLDGAWVRQLGRCDLIHTFYYGPIWARKSGRPFVFQTYGGDLTALPFMTDTLHHRYLAFRQRQGIQAANMVFLTNPTAEFCGQALRRLRLSRTAFLPLLVDAERFQPMPDTAVRALRAPYDAEWIFFHPPRQIWTASSQAWERKGNDRLFRAFARFLRHTKRRALLIAVAHGPDLGASRRLIQELGIEASVRWIPRQAKHELRAWYNLADAVMDQFILGDFGGCAFEAWACAKPVFMYQGSLKAWCEEEPPLVNVRTEDEIAEQLMAYTDSPERLRELGARAREWVLRHQHGDMLIQRYIAAYEDVLSG